MPLAIDRANEVERRDLPLPVTPPLLTENLPLDVLHLEISPLYTVLAGIHFVFKCFSTSSLQMHCIWLLTASTVCFCLYSIICFSFIYSFLVVPIYSHEIRNVEQLNFCNCCVRMLNLNCFQFSYSLASKIFVFCIDPRGTLRLSDRPPSPWLLLNKSTSSIDCFRIWEQFVNN